MWEWTNCPPSIRFRTIRALSGGVTLNAFSSPMRRCPSMRGIGSITTRFAMGSPSRTFLFTVRWLFLLRLVAFPFHRLQHGVPGDGGAGGDRQADADLVRRQVPVRQGDGGELRVERGEVVR